MNAAIRQAALSVVLCLVSGCVGAGRVEPTSAFPLLVPLATAELGSAAAAIWADGEMLLVLENSGTRVVRYTVAFAVSDTIPLTERVTAPAGVSADRFYYYIYDDHRLYRMAKDEISLQVWLSNVRVAGLASFEAGTVLISDADRESIWYQGPFGESRLFISSAEVARPGAMSALRDGSFAVISGASRVLHLFNRSGVVTRSVSLPAGCDLLAANDPDFFCLGVRGKPQVWVLRAGRMTGFDLPDSVSPLSFALVDDRLVVLDAGARLHLFRPSE